MRSLGVRRFSNYIAMLPSATAKNLRLKFAKKQHSEESFQQKLFLDEFNASKKERRRETLEKESRYNPIGKNIERLKKENANLESLMADEELEYTKKYVNFIRGLAI